MAVLQQLLYMLYGLCSFEAAGKMNRTTFDFYIIAHLLNDYYQEIGQRNSILSPEKEEYF